jgi:hypothetical protein
MFFVPAASRWILSDRADFSLPSSPYMNETETKPQRALQHTQRSRPYFHVVWRIIASAVARATPNTPRRLIGPRNDKECDVMQHTPFAHSVGLHMLKKVT